MAWTTPRTYTTGELVTAGMLNLHVRDNLTWLYDRSLASMAPKGTMRMQVADSLGGDDSKRLVFGGTTYTSWHICDGTLNIDGGGVDAPDLRNYCIISAGGSYNQDNTGGATTHDASHAHTGGYAADNTALPNHVHGVSVVATGGPSNTNTYGGSGAQVASADHWHNVTGNTGNPSSNPTHNHTALSTGTTAQGGNTTLATVPPYRAVYWFIYLGT